jgi:hypothetical protein
MGLRVFWRRIIVKVIVGGGMVYGVMGYMD